MSKTSLRGFKIAVVISVCLAGVLMGGCSSKTSPKPDDTAVEVSQTDVDVEDSIVLGTEGEMLYGCTYSDYIVAANFWVTDVITISDIADDNMAIEYDAVAYNSWVGVDWDAPLEYNTVSFKNRSGIPLVFITKDFAEKLPDWRDSGDGTVALSYPDSENGNSVLLVQSKSGELLEYVQGTDFTATDINSNITKVDCTGGTLYLFNCDYLIYSIESKQ